MKSREHLSQSQLKCFTKLTQKKYRQSEKKFLIEGTHLIQEALASDAEIAAILVTDAYTRTGSFEDIQQRIYSKKISLFEISERQLDSISDAVTSQGVIGVVKTMAFSLDDVLTTRPSVIVALENVSDPGNVGTILRTCDWFGVDAVLLSSHSAELFNPKVVRSTMGALFHLPIITEIDLTKAISKAKERGYSIVITSAHGHILPNKFPAKSFVIFGNEAHGISESITNEADIVASIPKYGRAESLNVAISCGIVLSAIKQG